MSARPASPFVWRRPMTPALLSGLLTLALTVPFSFVFLFGVLPPFWGGASRGIITETAAAWHITASLIADVLRDGLRLALPTLPISPGSAWGAGYLHQNGLWSPYLIRAGAVLLATLWGSILMMARSWRMTSRMQGFEYISGPRLFEGPKAIREARQVMATKGETSRNSLSLACDLAMTKTLEVLSFAYIGSQGSGKTTSLKFLLRQLIGRPDTKIILLDQKGDLTAEWPASDVILFAPHDQRSHAWDIGADITNAMEAQEFADTLVPTEGNDTVWPQGARQIIEAVIMALQARHGSAWGFAELLEALQSSPVKLRELVEPVRPDVLAFLALEDNGEFTRTSIGYITNLQAAAIPLLRPLALSWGLMPVERRVSLKAWVRDEGDVRQTLILQNNTDFSSISAGWMRQVIQRLVQITGSSSFEDHPDRRIWFILDEFPQLGHLPALLKIPATHRSKGATLVLTAQDTSQIYAIYEKHDADTLLSLMGTKVILKTGLSTDFVQTLNRWIGKLIWRYPTDSGVSENGARCPIEEHESDLLTQSYLSTLGQDKDGVSGLLIGLGQDVYRMHWRYQGWPKQRPAVRLASWADEPAL